MAFKLDKKHYPAIIEIYEKNTLKRYKKKICKICDNKRVVGVDSMGRLIYCKRCVNEPGARRDWIAYCKNTPGMSKYL